MKRLVLAVLLLLTAAAQAAEPRRYGLEPEKVAPDTYVFVGKTENFSPANGGNIVNTGFIVTKAGVVVIDTGPSLLYGREMRQAIAKVTPLPVVRVINTHLHPDHIFGNQAFADVGIEALPATIRGEEAHGKAFADNMYRMVGAWMQGTELHPPSRQLPRAVQTVGGHRLEMIAVQGHTDADLMVLDHATGVLFASDMAFLDRAPTTPHAEPAAWVAALDEMAKLPFTVLIPGHGRPDKERRAIRQTRDWLAWLDATLRRVAEDGLEMTEAMAQPIPERFAGMALAREEFVRSVSHLYPRLEQASLRRTGP
ncbi:putative metallohydrolase with beta-lactamase domain [Paramagnetospirillum caucaseum]|uniref:Putative metallohydrolase with beta-lactamase domain n=1 Tax=Paramagnetospirillum caucaseum TaxID=1244869 RepID=M2Y8W4_9PROT|nr:quinoprotein relay system zinc metallohydrolase 1 [Paramagnetospirillum caucaseum]EME69481.1 putative metallohydrolase with beta-lactamase domain [Paramagnetospirillum caucaseum]